MKFIFTFITGLVLKTYLAIAMLLVYREKAKANRQVRRPHVLPQAKPAHA